MRRLIITLTEGFKKQYCGIKNIIQNSMKLSVPHIDKNDIKSVNNVLKSEWISTSSKTVNSFEQKFHYFVKPNIVLL